MDNEAATMGRIRFLEAENKRLNQRNEEYKKALRRICRLVNCTQCPVKANECDENLSIVSCYSRFME